MVRSRHRPLNTKWRRRRRRKKPLTNDACARRIMTHQRRTIKVAGRCHRGSFQNIKSRLRFCLHKRSVTFSCAVGMSQINASISAAMAARMITSSPMVSPSNNSTVQQIASPLFQQTVISSPSNPSSVLPPARYNS